MADFNFGEGELVEFKQCTGKDFAKAPDDLWQSISAFANTRGGNIYLGVSKTGQIMNLLTDELDSLQREISGLLSNKFFNLKPKVKNEYLQWLFKRGSF